MTDAFLRGYVCAVATFISTHGMDTAVRDVWRAGGYTLAECAKNGVDQYDMAILKKYREELEQ
jgi:hypothetical protein